MSSFFSNSDEFEDIFDLFFQGSSNPWRKNNTEQNRDLDSLCDRAFWTSASIREFKIWLEVFHQDLACCLAALQVLPTENVLILLLDSVGRQLAKKYRKDLVEAAYLKLGCNEIQITDLNGRTTARYRSSFKGKDKPMTTTVLEPVTQERELEQVKVADNNLSILSEVEPGSISFGLMIERLQEQGIAQETLFNMSIPQEFAHSIISSIASAEQQRLENAVFGKANRKATRQPKREMNDNGTVNNESDISSRLSKMTFPRDYKAVPTVRKGDDTKYMRSLERALSKTNYQKGLQRIVERTEDPIFWDKLLGSYKESREEAEANFRTAAQMLLDRDGNKES